MTDKSLADVLDNTINQLSNGIQALGNSIAKVAPDAWKVLVHQQKMLAIQSIMYGALLFIGITIFGFVYKKFVYNSFVKLIQKDKDFVVGQGVCSFIFTVCTIISLINSAIFFSDGFVRYNSAEYYAAKDVLNLVKE